jgi:hypothetical protein
MKKVLVVRQKHWKIEIVAKDEAQASDILKTMSKAFDVAAQHNLPMDSMFFDMRGNKEMSSCELIKP